MSMLDGVLLPGRRASMLPVLVATTTFLLVLAAAASLALGRTAAAISSAARGAVTIEVIHADARTRAAAAARALAIARARPEVAAARPVADAEIAALVAPYLGDRGLGDLPLPALIDVTLKPGAASTGLSRALVAVPTAHVSAEGENLRPLARLIGAIRGVALAIMALAALATGLVTILVARGALEAHGDVVATLHDLGATDRQLAALLQARIARESAIGGAAGLALAAAAIVLVGSRIAALGGIGAGIGWLGWLLLAGLPILLTGLATLATRIAILRRLAEAP